MTISSEMRLCAVLQYIFKGFETQCSHRDLRSAHHRLDSILTIALHTCCHDGTICVVVEPHQIAHEVAEIALLQSHCRKASVEWCMGVADGLI